MPTNETEPVVNLNCGTIQFCTGQEEKKKQQCFKIQGSGVIDVPDVQSVPVGSVISFAGSKAPSGYLLCDGRLVVIEEYPELYGVIENTYKQDGDSDPTSFRIPDLRNEFIRGASNTLSLGSKQSDAIRNITGYLTSIGTYSFGGGGGCIEVSGGPNMWALGNPESKDGFSMARFNASLEVPTADENRPRNMALNFIIKAK